ncbi:MAG: hypothetical protein ABSB29_03055 [Nitrososphaerales archaeon]|jgi:uncharacterized membrane protein YkoI
MAAGPGDLTSHHLNLISVGFWNPIGVIRLPALTFAEIKSKVAAHLKTAVDADDFDIKSAKLEELQGLWKIDVEFKKPKAMFSETALLIIDARTGEVKEFRRGY